MQLNALFCCLGVTLRLIVINISSSSPAINTAAYYQRCVITCEMVAVHRRPRLQHLACCSVNTCSQSNPDIGSESQFLLTPPAFDAPDRGGGSRWNIAMSFGMKKLEWRGYLTVKNFDDTFMRFNMIHERDRHTDGQTDTA